MKYEVFISYSSQDREKAFDLLEKLEKSGISCWIDKKRIYGRHFPEEIAIAIENCKVLILLESGSSFRSEWVLCEVDLAREFGITIFPLRLEPVDIPINFRLQLAGLHHIDLFDGNPDEALERIIKGLNLLGVEKRSHEKPEVLLKWNRIKPAPLVVGYEYVFQLSIEGSLPGDGKIKAEWCAVETDENWTVKNLAGLPAYINSRELPICIEVSLTPMTSGSRIKLPGISLNMEFPEKVVKAEADCSVCVEEPRTGEICVHWINQALRYFTIGVFQQRKFEFILINKSNFPRDIVLEWDKSKAAGSGTDRKTVTIIGDESLREHFDFTIQEMGQFDLGNLRILSSDTPSKEVLECPIPYKVKVDPNFHPQIVNRRNEITSVHNAFYEASAGNPTIIYLHGDEGVGKSLLVDTAIASLKEDNDFIFLGSPPGESISFTRIKDLFRSLFGIDNNINDDMIFHHISNFLKKLNILKNDERIKAWVNCLSTQSKVYKHDVNVVSSMISDITQELSGILRLLLSKQNPVVIYLRGIHNDGFASELGSLEELFKSIIMPASQLTVILEWDDPEGIKNESVLKLKYSLQEISRQIDVKLMDYKINALDENEVRELILKMRPGTNDVIIKKIIKLSGCIPIWIREYLGLYNTNPDLYNRSPEKLEAECPVRTSIFDKRLRECIKSFRLEECEVFINQILEVIALYPGGISEQLLRNLLMNVIPDFRAIENRLIDILDFLIKTDFLRYESSILSFAHITRQNHFKSKLIPFRRDYIWIKMIEVLERNMEEKGDANELIVLAQLTHLSGKWKKSQLWNKMAADHLSMLGDNTFAVYFKNSIYAIDQQVNSKLKKDKANVIYQWGNAEYKRGKYSLAISKFHESINTLDFPDSELFAKCWFVISKINFHTLNLDDAISSFRNYLEIIEKNPILIKSRDQSIDFETLLRVAGGEKDLVRTYTKLAQWGKENNDRDVIVSANYVLNLNAGYSDDLPMIKNHYQLILDKVEEVDTVINNYLRNECYYRLCNAYRDWCSYDEALKWIEKSINREQQLSNYGILYRYIARYYRIYVLWQCGRYLEAEKAIMEIEKDVDKMSLFQKRRFLMFSGLLSISLGDIEKATNMLKESLEIARELYSYQGIINTTPLIAMIHLDNGNIEEGERLIKECAKDLKERFKLNRIIEYFNWNLLEAEAKLLNVKKLPEEMIQSLETWEKRLKECNSNMRRGPYYYHRTMGNIFGEISLCYGRVHDKDESILWYKKACEQYRKIRLPHLIDELNVRIKETGVEICS